VPIIKAIATGQRARLLRDQEVLDQSSDRLARAQRLAQQNEEIGIAILDELGDQRETLKRAYDKVLTTTSPPPTTTACSCVAESRGGEGPVCRAHVRAGGGDDVGLRCKRQPFVCAQGAHGHVTSCYHEQAPLVAHHGGSCGRHCCCTYCSFYSACVGGGVCDPPPPPLSVGRGGEHD
jgi:hypothetical protein